MAGGGGGGSEDKGETTEALCGRFAVRCFKLWRVKSPRQSSDAAKLQYSTQNVTKFWREKHQQYHSTELESNILTKFSYPILFIYIYIS